MQLSAGTMLRIYTKIYYLQRMVTYSNDGYVDQLEV